MESTVSNLCKLNNCIQNIKRVFQKEIMEAIICSSKSTVSQISKLEKLNQEKKRAGERQRQQTTNNEQTETNINGDSTQWRRTEVMGHLPLDAAGAEPRGGDRIEKGWAHLEGFGRCRYLSKSFYRMREIMWTECVRLFPHPRG